MLISYLKKKTTLISDVVSVANPIESLNHWVSWEPNQYDYWMNHESWQRWLNYFPKDIPETQLFSAILQLWSLESL